eukprot:TRINITY_DN859_c0_g1_i1.p1 TRINITY_DN859_c0_g1~~TRINITY_DN859_c0_g1_i1.p1  ORF type:complete len:148 (-),score=40.57 TRINITY_DN859_c0_g1_i1:8-451(-)
MKKLCFILFATLLSLSAFSQSSPKIIHLDDNSFKEKVFDFANSKEWEFKGDKPVIVDFYATWCGPCKRVAPVLEELQKEYGDDIQIYKVDTDKSPAVSAAFGIRSIPSFLFIPANGKPTMAKGALPKETFVKAITDAMGVNPPKSMK